MKKIIKFGSVSALLGVVILFFAGNVFAQTPSNSSACPPLLEQVGLCEENFQCVLPNILNMLLTVAFLAALVFLIYGGIRWVLSGGDKEGTTKAKGTVTAALIGLAIVLSSWILLNTILGFFGIGDWTNVVNIFGADIPNSCQSGETTGGDK